MLRRGTATLLTFACIAPLLAQADAAPVKASSFHVQPNLLYAMLALAIVQVIFIVSIAGIMRTMGGTGAWIKKTLDKRGGTLGAILLMGLAADANAQAYQGSSNTMSYTTTFWWLLAINILLFIILIVQMGLLRSLTRVVVGADEKSVSAAPSGPTWAERVLEKLTRQKSLADEKEIELHHDYDGIRELDNVLPPWWLWLFYGSILWGVIYLVNVHVIKIWPDTVNEYNQEMSQAKLDVDAYLATQTNTVDEKTVTFTDDPAVIGSGRELFTTYCVACHGPDGSGSETSVGPNLTDAYWLHGGGIKNVFKTIKFGVPEKGMIAWKAQLQPAEIRALASYILTLEGSGSATQKAPQGELWQEEGASATDTTAAPVADTVRVAMR